MSLGKVLLRAAVGTVMVGHGLQKLTGSFDGPGLDGAEKMMEGLQMQPARRNAVAAAVAETGGGAGLLLGAATPLSAAAVIGAMTTAVGKVHGPNGFWNANGGFEYNIVIGAAAASIAQGPGKLSVDAMFGKKKWGAKGVLTAVGVGVGSAIAAMQLGKRTSEAMQSASEEGDAQK